MNKPDEDPNLGVPQPTEEEIIAALDPGIRLAVVYLREHEIDTEESCQGGEGHGYPRPIIGFGGDDHAGLQAVWLLENAGWQVNELMRHWNLNTGGFTGWQVELESYQHRSEWPLPETQHATEGVITSDSRMCVGEQSTELLHTTGTITSLSEKIINYNNERDWREIWDDIQDALDAAINRHERTWIQLYNTRVAAIIPATWGIRSAVVTNRQGWFAEEEEDGGLPGYRWRGVLQLDGYVAAFGGGPWFETKEKCEHWLRDEVIEQGMW